VVDLMAVIWNTQRVNISAINTFVLFIVPQCGTRKEERFMQGSAPSLIALAVHACLDNPCLVGGLGVEEQQICLRKVPVIGHAISFCKKCHNEVLPIKTKKKMT
jgi:hypothetical protein